MIRFGDVLSDVAKAESAAEVDDGVDVEAEVDDGAGSGLYFRKEQFLPLLIPPPLPLPLPLPPPLPPAAFTAANPSRSPAFRIRLFLGEKYLSPL